MRSIPQEFYRSREWKLCRESYLQQHSLCELCLAKGIIVPAEIVHHVVHLNENNYKNPEVALNFDNLQAVCLSCHNGIHFRDNSPKRWEFNSEGDLQIK